MRRHCYDKPHRCPGWAGGGWKYPSPKNDICQSGSLATLINYKSRWRWWKSYRCASCGTRTIPFVTRWLDPTWWSWWLLKDVRYWPESYNHYRTKVGLSIPGAVYRATFYEVMDREPHKWGG